MFEKNAWAGSVLGVALWWTGCASDSPQVIASNCDKPEGCVTRQALKIDAVDILLVIDNSESIRPEVAALKSELPRMLTAITRGENDDTTFPPAESVHVAVTTTDMGIGSFEFAPCTETGRDGVFVRPGEVGVTCDVSYPGYLAYEGGPAAIATVESVACLPLVFPEQGVGCGFEQPLEAALKALWPSSRSEVTFLSGTGHGLDENAGFLRPDSLLVVVVVTDEDDCSARDSAIFAPPSDQDVNLRCARNQDKLYDTSRYIDALKGLRPDNDNVVFALVAGIPPELVSDAYREQYDLSSPSSAAAYYDAILADPGMAVVANSAPGGRSTVIPACTSGGGEQMISAEPPRRLVEIARGFGANAVVGSLCDQDFGRTAGRLVHTIGQRLIDAAR